MAKAINQRVNNTDIFVFGYNPQTNLVTYSRPFNAKEAESLAEGTNQVIASQYADVTGLRKGLSANKDGELYNMSTLKGIVANRVLMERTKGEQWLPTIEELIQLQKKGMLSSEVLIDGGIALYDGKNPDEKIAKSLMTTAGEKGYSTPVLASFKSLGLTVGGKRYGVTPQIISADGLVHGAKAQTLLDENNFIKGDSGVRRLLWYGGLWLADWDDDLDGFLDDCRVGRFTAVGSREKLEEEALGRVAPIRQSLDSIFEQCN